jgi:hypothetical protein
LPCSHRLRLGWKSRDSSRRNTWIFWMRSKRKCKYLEVPKVSARYS